MQDRGEWRLGLPVVGCLRTFAPRHDCRAHHYTRPNGPRFEIDVPHQLRDLLTPPPDPQRVVRLGLGLGVASVALVEAPHASRVVAPAQRLPFVVADLVEMDAVDSVIAL